MMVEVGSHIGLHNEVDCCILKGSRSTGVNVWDDDGNCWTRCWIFSGKVFSVLSVYFPWPWFCVRWIAKSISGYSRSCYSRSSSSLVMVPLKLHPHQPFLRYDKIRWKKMKLFQLFRRGFLIIVQTEKCHGAQTECLWANCSSTGCIVCLLSRCSVRFAASQTMPFQGNLVLWVNISSRLSIYHVTVIDIIPCCIARPQA